MLDHKKTKANGQFILIGNEEEIGEEEPYLLITHQCQLEQAKDEINRCIYYFQSRLDLPGNFAEDTNEYIMNVYLEKGIVEVNGKEFKLTTTKEKVCEKKTAW